MASSQMPASKQIEELLAGPLESLARFSSPGAQGSAELRLHSARVLRLLLDRAHQVTTEAGQEPTKLHLQALTKLCSFLPPRPPATIASLVLQEKLSILEKALGIGVLASEGPASSEAATLVLTLFTVLRDMVSWAVKDGTNKRRGRDILGPAFIPPIMNFVTGLLLEETQPSAPWDAAILQREAIATLVDLVVRDQPNAACLLGLPITCQSIFTVCLPQCGDFGVQVDIIDLLYRCAKHGTVPDTYLTAFSNKAKEDFRQSLTQDFSAAGIDGYDAALCRHAHDVIIHAGSFSRTAYVEGTVASGVLQPAPHEGFYIGSACISFHAVRGEQDAPPYLVSIPLAELDNIRCTLLRSKTELVLSANLKQIHPALDCISDLPEQRRLDVTLTFARKHAVKVATVAPQLNEAIKTSIASVESPGKVLPSEVPQRTAQLPLRQKVSWGIPAYAPLSMEPSHTTTTKRSRLSLQPTCQRLPVGTTVYGNPIKDPAHDTELDGPALPMPMQMDEPEVGSEAALSDGGMELQCGQKDPFLASDAEDVQEPTKKLPAAPRASENFTLIPSFTTAAEQGRRSPSPDITSQPRDICLQAAPDMLLPIDEGPEYDYLQAPGQLSDADDEEPWIPDPHKPKAARTLNFDLEAPADIQAAQAAQPAGSCSIPATEQKGADNDAAIGAVQTGQGQPLDNHLLHAKQAVPDLEKGAADRRRQPQPELQSTSTRKTAGTSKTPASAQREKQQTQQQRQESEPGGKEGKAARDSHRKMAAAGQGREAAKGRHAGNGKPQQTATGMHSRTTPGPKAQVRMAGQVQSPVSGRKASRTQHGTGTAVERSKSPGQPTTYARASSPRNVMEQAGNRPVDRAIPSPPVELPRGHLNMPNNQESASDHDETSNISTSERSESFTQALQKLQAANNAHLQQMTVGEKTVPCESKHTLYHETGGVTGISKQNAHPEGRPGAVDATQRNAATRVPAARKPDAQQTQRQRRGSHDQGAADAEDPDLMMDEAPHDRPQDIIPNQKQRPPRKTAVKKPPAKRAAPKPKPAKTAKTAKAAAQAAGKTGQRHSQTRMQKGAAAKKQSPQPTDPETSDEDLSLHLPPAKPARKVARQRQELTPEPDIVVELEKENVVIGHGLPSHSAMSNHLQPLSAPSSQEDPMTLGEQPLAQNPQAALMGLPDLPFMQDGLQRTPGLHLPKMPTPADRPVLTTPVRRLPQPAHDTGRAKTQAKKTPARAAVDSYEGGTDEEEEDNGAGIALKALAHIGSGAPGAASGLDSDDEEECMEEVQHVLKRIMAQKKAASRKKIAQIEQAARDHVSALMSTCSTAIQKEEKLAQAALSKAASQHEAKVRQHEQRLQDAHAAYQAAVAAEWAELQQTITSQAKTLQEAQAAQTKRQAGHKRKLAEVNQQAASIIAETEARVKRVRKKAGKMSSLAKILQPFTKERSTPSA